MKSIARGGIFRRFIIVFVCVSIPFLSITLALIWNADYQARVEASQAMSQNADYFAQSFESEYSRIVSQHQSLILDKDLNDLTYHSGLMNRLTWTTTINRLQDKLSLFKSTNAYVEAVSVYMPPMMRVISSSGGGRYVYDDLTLSQIERLESIHGLYGGAFIADGYLTLYTVNRRGSTVNYVIETVLSSDQLFSDYVHFAGGTGCFLYNHDGLIAAPESMGPARALSATLSRSPGEETVLLDGKRHIAVKRQLYIAGLTFVSYYDESLLAAPAQWYRFLIWAAIVLFFGLACLYAYMTHKYMNRPLMVLMEHFKRLESGDMESRITGEHHDEFGVLFARFNQMVDKLNSVILQSYRQTIYLQQAELKQLQAQINPHFLYNTYFMLHRLIRKNDPHAGEFSRMLGGYFNYIAKSQDEMPLFAEEINHARNYADIQALRFEGRVSIEFDYVLPEMKNMRVPQLILQPILENAFLHGLDNIVEDGLLKVSFLIMNGAYHIFVMNNGSNISGEALSGLESALATARDIQEQECSGLINIHRRLQLTFGGGSGLKITNKNDLFTVEMIIQKNMDVNK